MEKRDKETKEKILNALEDKGLVREFFIKRFGRKPEEDEIYFEEWVERFKYKNPEQFMDGESKMVYDKLIKSDRKIK